VQPSRRHDDFTAGAIECPHSGGRLMCGPLAPSPCRGGVRPEHGLGAVLGVTEELSVHRCMAHASGSAREPAG
jgi:hypothetical protein